MCSFFFVTPPPPTSTLFPYTTLFRSLEGTLEPGNQSVETHIGQCLGCRACETVCPSGVPYGHLLEATRDGRSEEHTSELQSRRDLVCRLLLEKKKEYF